MKRTACRTLQIINEPFCGMLYDRLLGTVLYQNDKQRTELN